MIEPDRRRGAGPTSYDDEWTTRRCEACGLEVDDPPHTMHPDLVAGLEDLARLVVAGAAAPGAPCRACAGATRVVAVRRHTFVREAGRDLVLAWSAAAPDGVALAWSTAAGDEPAEAGPALDGWLARDAALRHVQACQAVFQDGRALAAARGAARSRASSRPTRRGSCRAPAGARPSSCAAASPG
ncbi:MAG: hypothetical protein KF878_18380 [Planctomycetes bacterium]|nr:hypothetical protein [Planctomycetota bacterium]